MRKMIVLAAVACAFAAWMASPSFASAEFACNIPCAAASTDPGNPGISGGGDQGPCPAGAYVTESWTEQIGPYLMLHIFVCSDGTYLTVEEEGIWNWNGPNDSYDDGNYNPGLSNSDDGSDNQDAANDGSTYETYDPNIGEYVDQGDPGC